MSKKRQIARWALSVFLLGWLYAAAIDQARADFTVYAGDISFGDPSSTGQLIGITYNGNSDIVYAGQIPASFVSAANAGDFYMYCVDLNHFFSVPSNWTVNLNNTASVYGATVANNGPIAFLVNTFAEGRLDADHSAALQAAIWQSEYGANFQLTFASPEVQSAFDFFMTASSGQTGFATWLDPTSQTNYCEDPQGFVTAMPEPASVVMVAGAGVCFAGLYWFRRKPRTV
jgi:hypothetical protein